MIRPEALARLSQWREASFAAALAALGLWCLWLGGWVLWPIGATLLALGLPLGVISLRKQRFARATHGRDAGLIELDEAQLGWFGPSGGGFVSLDELVELRLIARGPICYWRLKQADGQALLVPIAAEGAAALFDAFTALPGMDSGALVAALNAPATADDSLGPVIWRRPR
ncbi:MAG: hypothetical protein JNN06_12280 [Gemmobacter sp.]|uniref:hypothetical protein n=1 Tax=Gemmobacter sp. TaxID=1898957 RepID=UPI001A5179B7|nr:hypothetical protein [Gemmobacter sp.]MBL8563046.1 hypothetical protein [Gemmobacter sp.]